MHPHNRLQLDTQPAAVLTMCGCQSLPSRILRADERKGVKPWAHLGSKIPFGGGLGRLQKLHHPRDLRILHCKRRPRLRPQDTAEYRP